ncbi:Uncharacterised protein [Escherichia coli]|nr:Uncharacterised protein [Escherichia coli]
MLMSTLLNSPLVPNLALMVQKVGASGPRY